MVDFSKLPKKDIEEMVAFLHDSVKVRCTQKGLIEQENEIMKSAKREWAKSYSDLSFSEWLLMPKTEPKTGI